MSSQPPETNQPATQWQILKHATKDALHTLTHPKRLDFSQLPEITRREFFSEDIPKWAYGLMALDAFTKIGFNILAYILEQKIAHTTEKAKQLEKPAKQLEYILDHQPTPQQLRERIVHRGNKIDLETERQKLVKRTGNPNAKLKVRVHGLGDSNFFMLGLKNDGKNGRPNPQDQPNSFAQVTGDNIQTQLDAHGIESWQTYTYAVPGAPSGPGFPEEKRKYGLTGPEQFNNPEFQKMLKNEEKDPSVLDVMVISATGDDWRMLVTTALALAHFLSSLQNLDQVTDEDVKTLKGLLAKSNDIAQQYQQNLHNCLTQVAKINKEREANGLLGIKVALAHPVDMHGVKAIPYKPLDGEPMAPGLKDILKQVDGTDRYYIDVEEVNQGPKIAYLLTVAMYEQLATVMNDVAVENPELETLSLEWMGLESITDFFSVDGHPGVKGTPMQAGLLGNLFQAVNQVSGQQVTLDKIMSIYPQVAQAVSTVTTAA